MYSSTAFLIVMFLGRLKRVLWVHMLLSFPQLLHSTETMSSNHIIILCIDGQNKCYSEVGKHIVEPVPFSMNWNLFFKVAIMTNNLAKNSQGSPASLGLISTWYQTKQKFNVKDTYFWALLTKTTKYFFIQSLWMQLLWNFNKTHLHTLHTSFLSNFNIAIHVCMPLSYNTFAN